MKFEFINFKDWKLDLNIFTPYIEKGLNLKFPNSLEQGVISIIFVDNNHIQKLNKEYRKIDSPTDVLSFSYLNDIVVEDDNQIIAEIYISIPRADEQRTEFGNTLNQELIKLFIHGVLHILGYDHELDSDYLIMSNLEDEIMEI